VAEALAVSLKKPLEWTIGFFFGNTLRRPRRTSGRPQAPSRIHQKRLGRSRPGQNGDIGRGVVWV